ncbi:MAG: hypothetical protein AAF773_14530 [Cyanobacteria bacterium P01_D01_bin.115]
MTTQFSFPKASLLLSGISLLLASISIILGQQVNYLAHLAFFNAMALLMVSLGIAALLLGLIGLWRTRGQSKLMWFANICALLVLGLYLFDS